MRCRNTGWVKTYINWRGAIKAAVIVVYDIYTWRGFSSAMARRIVIGVKLSEIVQKFFGVFKV